MTTEHNIQSISIEEFEKQRTGLGAEPSWQLIALREMAVGTAIQMDHKGLSCGKSQSGGQTGACSFFSMRTSLNKHFPERQYKFSHAKNGDIMAACYARDVNGSNPS